MFFLVFFTQGYFLFIKKCIFIDLYLKDKNKNKNKKGLSYKKIKIKINLFSNKIYG
jgi:hypothetical protein